MSTKLITFRGSLGERMQSIALLFVGVEIVFLFVSIGLDLVIKHHSRLVIRVDAISWLVCGFASIVLAATAIVKGPKRGAATCVLLLALAIFILCAGRFGLV